MADKQLNKQASGAVCRSEPDVCHSEPDVCHSESDVCHCGLDPQSSSRIKNEIADQVRNDNQISRRDFARILASGFVVTFSTGALSACQGAKEIADAALLGKRTVHDDSGREVTIPTPDKIKKVFFTSSLAQVYITALCPDLLGGSAQKFDERQMRFQPANVSTLPYLGTSHNNGEIDKETLLVEDIDLMFSISGVANTPFNAEEAINLQAMTKIPCLLVDGSFDKIPEAFRFLGTCLGREQKAEELAEYCERSYQAVRSVVQAIPEDEKISVYYAEGPEGLKTEPEQSQHMLAFLEAGARGAAQCEVTYGGGMTDVSLEQVLVWDPEVIIAWDTEIRGGAYDDIRHNRDWSEIRAVKDDRVYTMPNEPWAWLDRPPGVNRILGIHWLANLLYPDIYDIDIVAEVQDFFKHFYSLELSADEAKEMLGTSYPPPPRKPKGGGIS